MHPLINLLSAIIYAAGCAIVLVAVQLLFNLIQGGI